MYVIRADYDTTGVWENLYFQGDADYVAYDVKCSLVMGDSGSVRLSVPKSNPGYGRIRNRKTLLDFRKDGSSLGVFEVRERTRDSYGTMEVYAVGEMAWLFDSVQPQREYHDMTSRQFLHRMLEHHNEQCPEHAFYVGIVDVSDSNDSLYRYTNREQTLDAIRDKLVKRLGGNLRVRRTNGVRYLDYVGDQTYGTESEQTIRFGENILDYSDNYSVEDICTELVPLGARLENDRGDNASIGNLEQRVTIESVNRGSDHVSSAALVERFGHIRTTRTWDDVTTPEYLLRKAHDWLDTEQYERMHISVRAIDLSMSSTQFGELRMGDRAYVICPPLNLKASYVIRGRTYNPDSPESDAIDLGDTTRATSYVASQVKATSEQRSEAREVEHVQAEWLKSSIGNVTAMMTGARGGYKLTEYDEEGRWLADYIMDSMDKDTARVVKKTTVDGTAYSTNGIEGPYETAIMADGMILGKYIQADSITAEQISAEYTSRWETAYDGLYQEVNKLTVDQNGIEARVTTLRDDVFGNDELGINGLKADLEAAIKVNADGIQLCVQKGNISSAINQSDEQILITANKFGWKSNNSSLTTDGTLSATNANLVNANVTGAVTTTCTVANNQGRIGIVGATTKVQEGYASFYLRDEFIGEIGFGPSGTMPKKTLQIRSSDAIFLNCSRLIAGYDFGTQTETHPLVGHNGWLRFAGKDRLFVNGILVDD